MQRRPPARAPAMTLARCGAGMKGCAIAYAGGLGMEAWGLFVLGLVLLALGGDSFVKGASGLAQRIGASPFVAGLLLIAFGTSLPELAVNARAFWVGSQELALGNAVGSFFILLGSYSLAKLLSLIHI